MCCWTQNANKSSWSTNIFYSRCSIGLHIKILVKMHKNDLTGCWWWWCDDRVILMCNQPMKIIFSLLFSCENFFCVEKKFGSWKSQQTKQSFSPHIIPNLSQTPPHHRTMIKTSFSSSSTPIYIIYQTSQTHCRLWK